MYPIINLSNLFSLFPHITQSIKHLNAKTSPKTTTAPTMIFFEPYFGKILALGKQPIISS